MCVSLLVSHLYSPPLIKCHWARCCWHHGGRVWCKSVLEWVFNTGTKCHSIHFSALETLSVSILCVNAHKILSSAATNDCFSQWLIHQYTLYNNWLSKYSVIDWLIRSAPVQIWCPQKCRKRTSRKPLTFLNKKDLSCNLNHALGGFLFHLLKATKLCKIKYWVNLLLFALCCCGCFLLLVWFWFKWQPSHMQNISSLHNPAVSYSCKWRGEKQGH